MRSHSLEPEDTVRLLERVIGSERFPADQFNYVVAPVGTKPQTVGLYQFWRQHPTFGTIEYASPIRHKEEQTFPAGRTWLIDRSELWPSATRKH